MEKKNKIVSSASDPNKAIEDFPTSPWASNVTDILNTFHVNPDVYKRDRHLLNADVNGNPFTRNNRPANLASLVSNSIMEHNPSSLSENKKRDKQLLNADVNGNPFTRNTRPSNLASLVSDSTMEHNPSSLSENKNIKNKKSKNSVNKGVLSETIPGHRGQEDIDALLQFINSSDNTKKVGKTNVKSNSQSQNSKKTVKKSNSHSNVSS